MGNFQKDLKTGKKGENLVIKLLEENNIQCELNDNKKTRLYYDIAGEFGRTKFTMEVKNDKMAKKTGNLAIEFFNSGKDEQSGIDITKADLWVQLIPSGKNTEIWLASVADLRYYISRNTPCRTVLLAGDGNASIHLYARDRILSSVFKSIENLNEAQLKKLIRKLLNDNK